MDGNHFVSALTEGVSAVPVVEVQFGMQISKILGNLYLALKDETTYLKRKKFRKEIKNFEAAEIIDRLQEFFYEDMIESMKGAKKPIIIILDTYEKFINTFQNRELAQKNEKWFKEIVCRIPGVMWVIGGREPLTWEEDNITLCRLISLTLSDVRGFMRNNGIVDSEIQTRFYELSKGHPVFLNILMQRYFVIKQEGRTPEVSDFSREVLLEIAMKRRQNG